jgi:Recombination endonuclease VII
MSHGGNAQFDPDVKKSVWGRQRWICLICRRREGFRFQVLDHCHRCGLIRGGVCDSCNQRIGWYERSLERTAVYPSEPKAGCAHTVDEVRSRVRTGKRIVVYVEAHRQKCVHRLKRTQWNFKSVAPARLNFGKQIPETPVIEKRTTRLICRRCSSGS